MSGVRPRSGVISVLTAAILLGVSACGGGSGDDSGPGSGGDSGPGGETAAGAVPEDAFRAETEVAGSTAMRVEGKFRKPGGNDKLLAPGVELRITGVAQLDALDADVYTDLTDDEPGRGADGELVQKVYPAEGESFYAVTYRSDDPRWEPGDNELPESTASIVVSGNEMSEVFTTDEETKQQGTAVVSVPEDSRPDEALLEVRTDEKAQSLSLVNGRRVSTDVPQVYQVADHTVRVTDVEEFEENFTGWTGSDQRIAGKVADAFVVPWLDRKNQGTGWAGAGKTYVSVEMDWAEFSSTSEDKSSIRLELADGTLVQPDNDHSGLLSGFQYNAVFQVPADTRSATVIVTPKVKVGAGSTAKNHRWDSFTAKLSVVKESSTPGPNDLVS